MNHLKTGGSYFGAGSFKNYKYNGKELQETGMYAMDFRYYMPDIGRFSVADPLSAMTPGWTPYRFGFNNPVNFSDPSGLFEEMGYTGTESLSLGDSFSGTELMWPTRPGTSKNETFTDSDGTFTWDGNM
ncbi:RHS repeat-associated core domain-containing protein [Chryseobacterium flavum]